MLVIKNKTRAVDGATIKTTCAFSLAFKPHSSHHRPCVILIKDQGCLSGLVTYGEGCPCFTKRAESHDLAYGGLSRLLEEV
jgi:hypothetical protein